MQTRHLLLLGVAASAIGCAHAADQTTSPTVRGPTASLEIAEQPTIIDGEVFYELDGVWYPPLGTPARLGEPITVITDNGKWLAWRGTFPFRGHDATGDLTWRYWRPNGSVESTTESGGNSPESNLLGTAHNYEVPFDFYDRHPCGFHAAGRTKGEAWWGGGWTTSISVGAKNTAGIGVERVPTRQGIAIAIGATDSIDGPRCRTGTGYGGGGGGGDGGSDACDGYLSAAGEDRASQSSDCLYVDLTLDGGGSGGGSGSDDPFTFGDLCAILGLADGYYAIILDGIVIGYIVCEGSAM